MNEDSKIEENQRRVQLLGKRLLELFFSHFYKAALSAVPTRFPDEN